MKKTLIYLILLLIFIGISPIIGNKIVEYYVEEEIVEVRKKGITLNFKGETAGYLYTSRQYEFILTDVDAFARYLTEYGAGMLPPYTEDLLKSIVFRLDMKYHNIPFLEPISIDIYPMYISDGIMNKLKGSGNIFFEKFEKFIMSQGLLYHIDYNLLSENYKGHIKNIDYKERGYDGSNIILTLHNAVFNGTGSFSTSSSLQADVDKIMLKTSDTSKDVTLEINKFSSQSSVSVSEKAEELYDKSKELYEKTKDMYEDSDLPEHIETVQEKSEDTVRQMYDTSMKMKSMFFNTKDKDSDKETTIEVENADVNISSEQGNKKSKNRSYFFFESLNLKTKEINVEMSEILYSASMSNIDTASFQELQSLLAQAKSSPSVDVLSDLKVSAINLLSRGFKMQIPELSVQNIHFEGEDLGGLKLISAFNVKEDKNLAAKMLFSPLFIVKNIDFKLHLKVSKKIYTKFVQEVPLALLAMVATKQTKNDLIYDVSYINGNLKVNGNTVL
ncbi:MAG: hypothetical protein ACI9TV_000164 [Sulfurimonas sp.]|jgi:hypothetical protein|uniref:hypothetical protein n=1 Tax=Sulfurimonas sp. TaxID=2022749 RepID=UPI0039E5E95A